MKKIISIILIMCLFSSTFAFAGNDVMNNEKEFVELFYDQNFNDNSKNAENKIVTSKDFLNSLIKEGMTFEVKDSHYRVYESSNNDPLTKTMAIEEINYVLVDSVITINEIPKDIFFAQSKMASSDIRMREVTSYGSLQTIGEKNTTYQNIGFTAISVVVGISHPIPATIISVLTAMGVSTDPLDEEDITTQNRTVHRDTWYEAPHNSIYLPMLISETRATNVTFIIGHTDLPSGVTTTKAKTFNDAISEYSSRHNQLTLNINDAVQRYQLGYIYEPIVYRYYTGVRIDDTNNIN